MGLDWKYTPKRERERNEPSPTQPDKLPAEEKPESFASKHAKTITFWVCLAVLLATIGPFSVFWLHDQFEKVTEEQNGKTMTAEAVVALASLGERLTMENLKAYEGESSESEYREYYYIYFEHYILLAVRDTRLNRLDFCTLTDKNTQDSIDIRTDDVAAFLASH